MESKSRLFRFWPVYAVAFARTFSYTIYNLALPNFLIYFQHVDTSLIGWIISSYSLAFILGPIAALPITKRYGIRNVVLFSTIGSVLSVGMQLLFFNPIMLILLRALDGFIVGFFWPNLQMEISNWQGMSPPERTNEYFKKYGLSWNTGIILSEVVGFFIVFFGSGNEFFALIFSWIAMITMIPCAWYLEKPETRLKFIDIHAYITMNNDNEEISKSSFNSSNPNLNSKNSTPQSNSHESAFLLSFPALFYLVGTLIYAFIKTFYPFIIPLYFNNANIASYWVYLITFFHQLVQLVCISITSTRSAKTGYYTFVLSLILNAIFAIVFFFNVNMILLSIVFILNGILAGWMYNITSKIMLEYGKATKSLKYVTLYEFCNGIGFGLSPVMVGYVAKIDLNLNFPVFLILLIGISIILLVLSTKARLYLQKKSMIK